MANNIEKMLPCSFNLKATIKQIQSEAILYTITCGKYGQYMSLHRIYFL